MKKIYHFQFWGFLLFCSYLGLIPSLPQALEGYSDKALHSLGYLALFLSCSLAYHQRFSWKLIFAALLGYSVMIEVIQHFIPHRQFSLLDILANAFGLTLGLGLSFILGKVAKKTGFFRA
ncbi:VanZ family protein [Geopsychrobacter electrodiphilus]|uniref:VanZ family protein n=1 Tax=Geopsychrobacter electrodiphilus TaxID=225196 RepID=UPI000366CC59|nr:VanZ family protein [Geopsychrobacter electrodiphilus]